MGVNKLLSLSLGAQDTGDLTVPKERGKGGCPSVAAREGQEAVPGLASTPSASGAATASEAFTSKLAWVWAPTPGSDMDLGGARGEEEFQGDQTSKEPRFHNFTKLSQTAFCPTLFALSWTPNLHKSWEVITKT